MTGKLKGRLSQLLSLLVCVLMVAAVSIRRDGKLWGHSFRQDKTKATAAANDTLKQLDDGTIVVNTTSLGKDIIGYGGTVPLEIYVKDGKVSQVKALPNTETPEIFEQAKTLLAKWQGKTLAEASSMKVDAVSGATYSSKAIIGNMLRGLAYAAQKEASSKQGLAFDLDAKSIGGLVVALMAALVPLWVKDRRYRLVQQVLNVVVLGFWCGACLSYSALIGFLSNGIHVSTMLLPIVLMIVAFVYPLFGKKSYYCGNVCPYGSLQELAGRCVSRKIKMKAATVRRLDTFRKWLWAALMVCLWTGVWFDWVNYEPFSAFMVQTASWIVIAIAVLFVFLSVFIPRPYCRFVCPMGTLFKMSQKNWVKKG